MSSTYLDMSWAKPSSDLNNENYSDKYEGMEYVEYDAAENSFYDQCGIHIINIFDMITPSDLYLFRHNPEKFSYFPHRYNKHIVVKLIMNGVYDDEEKYTNVPCHFSGGGGCWFSDSKTRSREEICSACRGGDF